MATDAEKKIHKKLLSILKMFANPGDINLTPFELSKIELLALIQMINDNLDKEKKQFLKITEHYNEKKRIIDGFQKLKKKAIKNIKKKESLKGKKGKKNKK